MQITSSLRQPPQQRVSSENQIETPPQESEESEGILDKVSLDGRQAVIMGTIGVVGAGMAALGGAPLPVAALCTGGLGLSVGLLTAAPFETMNWRTAIPAAVAGTVMGAIGSLAGPVGIVGAAAVGAVLGGVVAPSFGLDFESY